MINDPTLRVVPPSKNLREEDIDSAVATVESSPQMGNLKLRSDLLTAEGPPGQIRVRAPESSTWFSIYDMEWRIAKVLDGTRSLAEIARDMARFGMAADPKLVRSFARELKGYGFLEGGAATVEGPLPENAVAADGASIEAQQFLSTAMALQAKGDLQGASNYFLAFLEIEPTNHSVRDLLRQLHHDIAEAETNGNRRPAQMQDESSVRRSTLTGHADLRRPTMIDDLALRRPTMMEEQRRATLTESAEFRMPTLTEQAAVIVPQPSGRLPLIAGIAIGAALLSVGIVVSRSFSDATSEKPKPETSTPPATNGGAAPLPIVVSETAVAVQLETVMLPAAKAPAAGVISELLVRSGDIVTSGQSIATLVDDDSYEKIEKFKAAVERFKKKSRDPVMRHYKQKAEQNLAVAQKKAQRQSITSAESGTIELAVNVGEAVGAGALMGHVGNRDEFIGKAPARLLPKGYQRMDCEARLPKGADTFACSVTKTFGSSDAQTVNISISNVNGALSTGAWVEVSFIER